MDERQLPFGEHLAELRVSLRNSVIAVLVAFCTTFYWSDNIFHFLEAPLKRALINAHLDDKLRFFSVIEPFFTYMKVAFFAGIFLASPFVFHQVWRFVAPGLYQKERRAALPFAFFSGLFFVGGAAFCYYVALPGIFEFLINYKTDAYVPNLSMKQHLDIELKLLMAFGLVFELPLLIFFLSHAGIVTHRTLWKFNKYAVVIAFVVAAILTPPDFISQIVMAVPVIILYNVSIFVSYVITKNRERKERVDQTETTAVVVATACHKCDKAIFSDASRTRCDSCMRSFHKKCIAKHICKPSSGSS